MLLRDNRNTATLSSSTFNSNQDTMATGSNVSSNETPSELAVASFSKVNSACERAVDMITKKGTAAQALTALEKFRDIQSLPAVKDCAETAKILAINEGKRLDLQSSSSSSGNTNSGTSHHEESLFKITFKRTNFAPDLPTVNPVKEFFLATEHLIQIIDSYSTALGEVICLQTDTDLNHLKEKIANHSVSTGQSMTQLFDIHAQVVSPHSIKTAPFKRQLLADNNLLTTLENGKKILDTTATIKHLQLYNSLFFKASDIDTIEMFGSNNADDSSLVSLKIHISLRSYREFIRRPRPTIMLLPNSIKVYEQVMVIQCLKCVRFEHTSDICKNSSRCRFCGSSDKGPGGHYSKNCPKKDNPTCANCIDDCQRKNLDISSIPSHHATSFKCPLLKNQANTVRAMAKRDATKNFTLKY